LPKAILLVSGIWGCPQVWQDYCPLREQLCLSQPLEAPVRNHQRKFTEAIWLSVQTHKCTAVLKIIEGSHTSVSSCWKSLGVLYDQPCDEVDGERTLIE
jgi:hypothetical protein